MKLLVWFIVFLLLAGAAFVVGWVQILLPPETYTVLFSKTGGYDEAVIRPGEFSWRWERLIPTNTTLFTFDLSAHLIDETIRGRLPAADLYAASIGEPASRFDFAVRVQLSVRLPADSLPRLVSKAGLRPETLQQWYDLATSSVARVITDAVLDNSHLAADSQGLNKAILAQMGPLVLDLEISSLTVQVINLPDTELYESVKDKYLGVLEAEYQARLLAITSTVVERESELARARNQLELLRMYGEILDAYPVLLEYMQLRGTGDITGSLGGLALPSVSGP